MRPFRYIVLILVAVMAQAAMAQTFRGSLSGTVLDAQGAVVANAAVQLTNPATDTTVNGVSNGAGEFSFPELPPGTYHLKVTAAGFETKEIDNIAVEVSKVTTEKVDLIVGRQTTVVEVAADVVSLDTTASSLVSVVETKQVADMPINGRDFTQMVKFTLAIICGIGERAAYDEHQLPDRRNGQRGRVPRHRGIEPGRYRQRTWRLGADRGDRPVLGAERRRSRHGTQRGRQPEHGHQIRHQSDPRRPVLLQPQRVLRRH